jgi:dihydroceramidase
VRSELTLTVQIIKLLNHEQVNFQFSPYIAEMANAFSNVFTITLALCGGSQAMKERLPSRFPLGYAVRRPCLLYPLKHSTNPKYMHLPKLQGVGLVGLGSFFFHTTLLFEAQLADELPMIYVGSMCLFILFDNKPGFGLHSTRSRVLILLLALFDVLFTWS